MQVAAITPDVLRSVSDEELLSLNLRLHQLYGSNFLDTNRISRGDLNRETLLNAALFVWAEMRKRKMTVNMDSALYQEAVWGEKSDGTSIEKAAYTTNADAVIVYHSGGKDSDATLLWALDHFTPSKIHLINVDTGSEMGGNASRIRNLATKFGAEAHIIKTEQTFFEYCFAKNKWNFRAPFCQYRGAKFSPYVKDKIHKIVDKLGKVLTLEGTRRAESKTRADKPRTAVDFTGFPTYRPILNWSERDVWLAIKEAKIDPFWPYKEGCSRMGCWCCPFTANTNIAVVKTCMPEKWAEWKRVEKKVGHTILHNFGTLEEHAAKGLERLDKAKERMRLKIEGHPDGWPVSKDGDDGEFDRYGVECFGDFVEKQDDSPRETAAINPGSSGALPPINLDDVERYLDKPIVLRSPAISIVGSVCTQGQSRNDVDVLIHGPLDQATRDVVAFRIGRALPPEISERVQIHDDTMGGPFTDHVHLYDLALVPREDRRSVIRMEEAMETIKGIVGASDLDATAKVDPFMEWPDESSLPAVLQLHARGDGVHLDFRIGLGDHLVGWTIPIMIEGSMKDLDSIPKVKALFEGYSAEKGNEYLKPILAPNGLLAIPKLAQPNQWLNVDERVFEHGAVGATPEEDGVMVAIARPVVSYGMQAPYFHEYFLEKAGPFTGILALRQIVPEQGDPFWRAFLTKSLVPSILRDRAVEGERTPPLGQSALPPGIEDAIPDDLAYWDAKDEAEATAIRDKLVEAKIITDDTVQIVDEEFVVKQNDVQKQIWGSSMGKKFLSNRLIGMFPDHKTYVEPFAGSGAVLFKKEPSKKEVLNDLDKEIMFAFRFVKRIDDETLSKLRRKNWVGNKEYYYKLRDSNPSNAVDRFYKFLYTIRFSFNRTRTGYSAYNDGKESNVCDKIEKFRGRIKQVSMRCSDYENVVKEFDGKDTLFFFDPPYVGYNSTPGKQTNEFDEDRFVKLLKKIKGKFIVTYGIRSRKDLFDGFNVKRICHEGRSGFGGGKAGRTKNVSLIVTNYDINSCKKFVDTVQKEDVSKATEVPYVVGWLYWRGPMIVRTGPSRQVWLLMLAAPSGKTTIWTTDVEPITATAPISATMQIADGRQIMTTDREIKPGESIDGLVLNATKETRAWLRIVDRGTAIVEEDGLIRFSGGRLDRSMTFTEEEPGSRVWIIESAKAAEITRADLKPGDRFRPMKPRSGLNVGVFTDVKQIFDTFATDEALLSGIYIEPKYNGVRTIASKGPDGKVEIWFEDSGKDRSVALPTLTAELASIPGEWIIDGELLDTEGGRVKARSSLARYFAGIGPQDDSGVVLNVFRVLSWNGDNLLSEDEDDQTDTVREFVASEGEPYRYGKGHLRATQRQIVHTREQLEGAIAWAKGIDGSEGAMLKRSDATYSLGGDTDSWVKLKTVRTIFARWYKRDLVQGTDDVWNYQCAIGPLADASEFKSQDVLQIGNSKWLRIGTTANTSINATWDDVLEVEAFEIHVSNGDDGMTVHWFGPAQVQRAIPSSLHEPSSVRDVVNMARPNEITKISILKTSEERYIMGIVLEPNDGDGAPLSPDAQRDIYSAEDIRGAAHLFMAKYQVAGFMHRTMLSKDKVQILESFLAPVDFWIRMDGTTTSVREDNSQHVRKGTWILSMHVSDDALWNAIKQGSLTGFSIGGDARRYPVDENGHPVKG